MLLVVLLKRMKKLIVLFLLITFGLQFFVITSVFAKGKKNEKIIVLGKDYVVDEDYFAFGDKVTISGTVNGDVYAGGASVIVDGTVNGDLLAGGGSVIVSGNVLNDARIGAGQVLISGNINGNVSVGGGNVTFSNGSQIGGSVVAGAGVLNLFGPIGRGATIGAGDATISNSVGGNVKAGVGELTLGNKAQINGNLQYWSDNEATLQQGAVIRGESVHNLPKTEVKVKDFQKPLQGLKTVFKLVSLISTFILGLIFLKFLPKFTEDLASTISKKTLISLGLGLVAIILIPIVSILLLITVVGIPVAVLLLLSLIAAVIIFKVFVAMALGKFILKLVNIKLANWLILLIGLVVYTLVTSIPVIGGIITILALLVGLGAIIIAKKEYYKVLRAKDIV